MAYKKIYDRFDYIDEHGRALDSDFNEFRDEHGRAFYVPEKNWHLFEQVDLGEIDAENKQLWLDAGLPADRYLGEFDE